MADAKQQHELDVLRAKLEEAEHGVANLAKDAPEDTRKAAEKVKSDAEKALGDFKNAVEVAERAAAKTEKRVVKAFSAQSVKGLDALSVEEQAKRREPLGQ
jgi:ElaB/YqjD/DUF883 family membrane-anchored ribosome-binding protein